MNKETGMNSKERMLATMEYGETDYTPCSFMLFFNEYYTSKTEEKFIQRQIDRGLDAYVHTGFLPQSLHPEATCTEWTEEEDGTKLFCRKIETPKGPLTQRIKQREGWPRDNAFPLLNDWIVTRAQEVLVKPEEDLEKLPYVLGPAKDEDIEALKETAAAAKKVADKYGLLQVGGWKGTINPWDERQFTDADLGVMGCDAMAWLSGYEDIMVLSLTKPEIIKQYANIIHEWTMKQIEIYLDVTESDIIWRRGWYETTEFWTPEAYREIIAPTLKKESELVHQAGKKYGYIITSSFLPLLDDILDADIDVLIGLDPKEGKGTDAGIVKEKFLEKKKAIWGGVSGAVTVELETEKDTEQAVIQALEVLGKKGGFILSPVDNVREDTENARRNTQVFIDTWKKHRSL